MHVITFKHAATSQVSVLKNSMAWTFLRGTVPTIQLGGGKAVYFPEGQTAGFLLNLKPIVVEFWSLGSQDEGSFWLQMTLLCLPL